MIAGAQRSSIGGSRVFYFWGQLESLQFEEESGARTKSHPVVGAWEATSWQEAGGTTDRERFENSASE